MKKLFLLLIAVCAMFAQANAAQVILEGNLDTPDELNLINTNTYVLRGFVRVQAGLTLNIQAGTIIFGETSSNGTLIIQRFGKINAVGTKFSPIVFTSDKPSCLRRPGDWGGIVICGAAPNNFGPGSNDSSTPTSGLQLEGGYGAYCGGNNYADNSGTLEYVRVEFPGYAFAPNQEINGITFGSVGAGTRISYVQVSFSADDSFEFFGGAVQTRFLVSYYAADDDFDTDYGYIGTNQFAVAYRHPQIADVSGSNGFESDNHPTNFNTTPRTKPTYSNYSIVGPRASRATVANANFRRGAHIRRGSAANIYNSAFLGWPVGIFIEGPESQLLADNGTIKITNSVIAGTTDGTTAPAVPVTGGTTANWWNTDPNRDSIFIGAAQARFEAPFNWNQPDGTCPASFCPDNAPHYINNPSARLTPQSSLRFGSTWNDDIAGVPTPLTNAFFFNVTYRGAFHDGPAWSNVWTVFNPGCFNYFEGQPTKGPRFGTEDIELSSIKLSAVPNPASEVTSIEFTLTESSDVEVSLLDMKGAKVADVTSGAYNAGVNSVPFNTTVLEKGVYIVKIQAGAQVQTTKLVVVK